MEYIQLLLSYWKYRFHVLSIMPVPCIADYWNSRYDYKADYWEIFLVKMLVSEMQTYYCYASTCFTALLLTVVCAVGGYQIIRTKLNYFRSVSDFGYASFAICFGCVSGVHFEVIQMKLDCFDFIPIFYCCQLFFKIFYSLFILISFFLQYNSQTE